MTAGFRSRDWKPYSSMYTTKQTWARKNGGFLVSTYYTLGYIMQLLRLLLVKVIYIQVEANGVQSLLCFFSTTKPFQH